ncbi:type VI secretion system Vgr family protein [Paraherbaspirillum soli]|uniref:Type VI secretion system Vgr family protein n=1 Tax=Paraherbaspirillum soli TaxID=631222 RepID=A0ABW0M8A0_9BURK
MFHARTLTVRSPAIADILGQPALVAVKLSGSEGLNQLFAYQLVLKTPTELNHLVYKTASFERDDFLGQELTCTIELEPRGLTVLGAIGAPRNTDPDTGTREISGLIADMQLLRAEDRHVFYQITLRPWLHLATLTSDCRIFQDQTVLEIVDSVLAAYPFTVDKRLIDRYPKRDYQTQYNESDFHFFCRLCEEWGINWFFEHRDGRHRMVLIDNMGGHQPFTGAAYRTLAFHPPGHKTDAEFIDRFELHNRLTSGRYRTSDYDYTRPQAQLERRRSDPRPTAHNAQEIYRWHADAHYSQPQAGPAQASNDPRAEGDFLSRIRMQALRSPGHRAHGGGRLRGMVPGCTFKLNGHPNATANSDYLILSTRFEIEEVAQASQGGDSPGQHYRVEVDFEAHPCDEQFVPACVTPKPLTHGPQIATVVGPPGENLWTDALGRIKVQFPWDRLGVRNQHSSCWLRVAAPWAGAQLGAMFIPRIGQEVLVDFIGGNPSLPICSGRLYHQWNSPPWQLPAQQALSGLRSRELTKEGGNAGSGRSNHLVLDDTERQIQVQLGSAHQHSQLNLGHITRIAGNTGRTDFRGEGLEARTDGAAAIRGGQGLLLSSDGRPEAHSHMMDLAEPLQRLRQAHKQHQELAALAQQHRAQETGANAVGDAIQAQNDALKGLAGSAKDGKVPQLGEPHVIVASAAGIAASAAQAIHIASGSDTAVSSGRHVSFSALGALFASAGRGLRWFAHALGIKLVAAAGIVEIKALSDALHLFGKLDVEIASSDGWIVLKAKRGIRLHGNHSELVIGGEQDGLVGRTPGVFHVFSADPQMPGPQSAPLEIASLARGDALRGNDSCGQRCRSL